ncbi:hypothetical protein LOC67_25465 [Stieleria sp. JC731]|uniref:di-heme oxidoredictase family protein n=1 Tax=Pirellulaceae TaxID=2691357 RepID=UPI001E580B23|nr:di-heme oxidoredictase family protein [Stieleria sp. JC731]MCC9603915.1 hypothetical protein [Stieleria sp. JC731]
MKSRLVAASKVVLLSSTLIGFVAPKALGVSPAAVGKAVVNPATISQGKQLFEHQWTSRNPRLGSDGLGPLFNATSCVGCHNQGGAGGGGEAKFNAKTIGIEKLQIDGGQVTPDVLATMVRSMHPGFQLSDGTLINTCSISHFGGTAAYQEGRSKLIDLLPVEFADEGGSANASEVRRANAFPIHFQNQVGQYNMQVQARLYQRNTTALFGAGLIDQVPDKAIERQAKLQQRHPEISGRPSTLRDGRFGKFGWRGNLASLIDFTDQACANEVGLRTDRRQQPSDPTNPDYRNPAVDISDAEVRAMRDYLAALPAPTRKIPQDLALQKEVMQGEQLFASVGCAVCHVPNLGPANGAYTDLLLHEMGPESMDLNHAEPYIQKMSLEQVPRLWTGESVEGEVNAVGTETMGAYYGPATRIDVRRSVSPTSVSFSQANPWKSGDVRSSFLNLKVRRDLAAKEEHVARQMAGDPYSFVAPQYPAQTLLTVPRPTDLVMDLGRRREQKSEVNLGGVKQNDSRMLGTFVSGEKMYGNFDVTTNEFVVADQYIRVRFERTKFNEEWRTPPLWGVADSAPYMHDGRAGTLLEAIAMHGGEASGTRDRFLTLPKPGRDAIIAFLQTMVAPSESPLTSVTAN